MRYAVFEQESKFRKDGELEFFYKNGYSKINIELPETTQKGLMFRKSLPPNGGMFFEFEKEDYLSFWMKNTYIPLDIIYVNKNYQIVDIHENTTPMSKRGVVSKKPAKYVIEVNAGFCERYNIKEGGFIDYVI